MSDFFTEDTTPDHDPIESDAIRIERMKNLAGLQGLLLHALLVLTGVPVPGVDADGDEDDDGHHGDAEEHRPQEVPPPLGAHSIEDGVAKSQCIRSVSDDG